MITRRTINKLIASLSVAPLYMKSAVACSGDDNSITMEIPKNHLQNFYTGIFEEYLATMYVDKWMWSDKVTVNNVIHSKTKRKAFLTEDSYAVPVRVTSIFESSNTYCSNIDIIYRDETSKNNNTMYFIASVKCKKTAYPLFATKFRMSSDYAKIYVAFTYRNVVSNKIENIMISKYPEIFKFVSCNSITFNYVNT